MGVTPKDEDMPIELNSLSEETQLAFEIYQYLPERWEGMSGSYLGKDLNILPFLLTQYQVEGKEVSHILFIIQYIDGCVAKRISGKQSQERELNEARNKWQAQG